MEKYADGLDFAVRMTSKKEVSVSAIFVVEGHKCLHSHPDIQRSPPSGSLFSLRVPFISLDCALIVNFTLETAAWCNGY
jgi:hypothetical protein